RQPRHRGGAAALAAGPARADRRAGAAERGRSGRDAAAAVLGAAVVDADRDGAGLLDRVLPGLVQPAHPQPPARGLAVRDGAVLRLPARRARTVRARCAARRHRQLDPAAGGAALPAAGAAGLRLRRGPAAAGLGSGPWLAGPPGRVWPGAPGPTSGGAAEVLHPGAPVRSWRVRALVGQVAVAFLQP